MLIANKSCKDDENKKYSKQLLEINEKKINEYKSLYEERYEEFPPYEYYELYLGDLVNVLELTIQNIDLLKKMNQNENIEKLISETERYMYPIVNEIEETDYDGVECISEFFDGLIELNPENPEHWKTKGNYLNFLKESEEALKCFEKAESLKK